MSDPRTLHIDRYDPDRDARPTCRDPTSTSTRPAAHWWMAARNRLTSRSDTGAARLPSRRA